MKIWTIDKLIQILVGLQRDEDTIRKNSVLRPKKDLAQALQEEKVFGTKERDPNAPQPEFVVFKGPYILVRDASHVHQPIIFREYRKCENPREGDWPQFQTTSAGRCPFIKDPSYTAKILAARKRMEEEKQIEHRKLLKGIENGHEVNDSENNESKEGKYSKDTSLFKETVENGGGYTNLLPNASQRNDIPQFSACLNVPKLKREAPRMVMDDVVRADRKMAVPRWSRNATLERQKVFGYRPPDDVAASGMVNSSHLNSTRVLTSTTTSNTMRHDVNTIQSKEVRVLKRKVLKAGISTEELDPKVTRLAALHSSKKMDPPELGNAGRLNGEKKLDGDGKTGFCENCRVKYEHYNLVSKRKASHCYLKLLILNKNSTLIQKLTANMRKMILISKNWTSYWIN